MCHWFDFYIVLINEDEIINDTKNYTDCLSNNLLVMECYETYVFI